MQRPPAPRVGGTCNRGSQATTSNSRTPVCSSFGQWSPAGRRTHGVQPSTAMPHSPHQCVAALECNSTRPHKNHSARNIAGPPTAYDWQPFGGSGPLRRGHRISSRSVTTCGLAATLAPLQGLAASITEPLARVLVRDLVRPFCARSPCRARDINALDVGSMSSIHGVPAKTHPRDRCSELTFSEDPASMHRRTQAHKM